jgi:hypothetical protein
MVWPGEFLTHGTPGLPPTAGAEVSVVAARESRTMQPGFYFAFGETLGDQEEEMSLLRLYWNVTAPGAAALISSVTAALNRFAIPFRLKSLAMAELYDRTDAAVLYFAKRYFAVAAQLLAPVYQAVRPFLNEATPLFSKPLALGLGFAENPRASESFGMHRCRLVAEAVCKAHARGADSPDARLAEVVAVFAAEGLSLDRPFLNSGSADRYAFDADKAE